MSVSNPILETSHLEVEETSEVKDSLTHWLGSPFRATISKCPLIPFHVTSSFPLLCPPPREPSGSHALKSCAPNASSPFSLLCHPLLYLRAIVCCESICLPALAGGRFPLCSWVERAPCHLCLTFIFDYAFHRFIFLIKL